MRGGLEIPIRDTLVSIRIGFDDGLGPFTRRISDAPHLPLLLVVTLLAVLLLVAACDESVEDLITNEIPIAAFSVYPDQGGTTTPFSFDASASEDVETQQELLRYD